MNAKNIILRLKILYCGVNLISSLHPNACAYFRNVASEGECLWESRDAFTLASAGKVKLDCH
jgi:hypothetical protein